MNFIAPPLRPFPVGTVHIGVAHAHVEGALCFLPVLVQKWIVAVEIAAETAIVTGFAELYFAYGNSFGHNVVHVLSVKPGQMLIALFSCFGDIFAMHAFRTCHNIVVGMQPDQLAGRSFQLHIWREMRIVR